MTHWRGFKHCKCMAVLRDLPFHSACVSPYTSPETIPMDCSNVLGKTPSARTSPNHGAQYLIGTFGSLASCGIVFTDVDKLRAALGDAFASPG